MARRDYALNIVADIADYQKRLAQIPGYTDKQAAKAAERLERRLSKAQEKAAREAQRAAEKSAKGWRKAFAGVTLAISPQDIQQVGRALFDLTQQAQDARNELADAATRTGLTTETLAALRYAAEGSGLEFRALESSLNQFPKRLADFARGSGEARYALEGLGFTADDVVGPDGELASSDKTFRQILMRLGEVESQTERSALATQIFGEAGTGLLQALGDPTALDAYSTRVALIDDRTRGASDNSGAWQRSVADLNGVWRAATGQLADAASETGVLDGAVFAVISNMVVWPAIIDKVVDDLNTLAWAAGHVLAGEFGEAQRVMSETGTTWEETGDRIRSDLQAFYNAQEAIQGIDDSAQTLMMTLDKEEQRAAQSTSLLRNPTAWADGIKEGVKRGIDGVMTKEDILAWRHEQQRKRVDQQLADSVAQMEAEDAFAEKVRKHGETLDAQRQRWHDEEMRRQQAERDFKVTMAQSGLDAVASILHSLGEENKAAARAAAIADKASAVFGIGVNTAQAIAKAIALFGPPPSPVGIAGITTAGVIGATQAAAVLAQPLPKFHTGTAEVPALLTPGEAVLNPRAAEAMGRDAIEALNRGTAQQSGPVTAVVHWNRRSLDRVVSETVRADGRLPREIVTLGTSTTTRTPYT